MIPRAVDHVFCIAKEMKAKGWEYKMEGQFLEIVNFLSHNLYSFPLIAVFYQYNETINDLLGKGGFDKKKHEIKHDPKIA